MINNHRRILPKKKTASRKSGLLITGLVIIFLIICITILLTPNILKSISFFKLDSKNKKPNGTENFINYSPPTDDEKNETNSKKDSLSNKSISATPSIKGSGSNKRNVRPILSSWGRNPQTNDIEAAAYVPDTLELDGVCTLTLSKNDVSVSESKSASPDAQNVSCGFIAISRNKLSPGTWNVIMNYSSSSSIGTSNQTVTIEVN